MSVGVIPRRELDDNIHLAVFLNQFRSVYGIRSLPDRLPLPASCQSNGKGISFFMRKVTDALSKWAGEAERQLRLLFDEARNQQPSIIFFDEIDGLAPVRSSKQGQIHS